MAIHRALGLTDAEHDRIVEILGRAPNHLELAMYAVMWSEHCSYKSSKVHLRRLPTEAPWVIVGPGENAGVVDVGDGLAAAIRIESHNHPSAIEPYQGAATGVGGILRDIFTMGARPIAIMDALRFGPLDDPRSRWIAEGVVAGVSGYGNAVGVPNLGGETVFDPTYAGNPLVNVLCLGLLPVDRLVLGQASGVGNLAVLLGSTTGRDGIGGVSVLASAGFGDDDASKRPSVQVGDPFEEKRLIEACLALLDAGLVVGIQDLGGAGLCCATSETASRAQMGMDVDVSAVPRREPGMEPFEVMTSESQERMLAIVEPEQIDAVLAICARWEVRAAVVGRVTETGRLRILDGPDGAVLADLPAASLHDAAPVYERPMDPPARDHAVDPDVAPAPRPDELAGHLLAELADSRWIWSQYDHQLFCNTVIGPGAAAAVLRLRDPATDQQTGRGLALTTDGNHRWCAVDPRVGTARLVAESVVHLALVGAAPLAVVNNLNFGNPEHPVVMWQLSEAVDGLAEACTAMSVPVVGGNVSLYNESRGADIDPTPVIGMLGLIERLHRVPPRPQWGPGQVLVSVGDDDGSLAGSRWAWAREQRGGTLPAIDWESLGRTSQVLRALVTLGLVQAAAQVGDGGLLLALAEAACRGGVGLEANVRGLHDLVGEGPGRVVLGVAAADLAVVERRLDDAGVAHRVIGSAGGDAITLTTDLGTLSVPLHDARTRWDRALPDAFAASAVHG